MKIVIITNYWKNTYLGGGVKEYIINLANELTKKENISVNVLFKEGEDRDNCKINGNLLFAIKSQYYLRNIKPDVINSHGRWFCLLSGCIYKKYASVKLIHTFHTVPSVKLSIIKRIFMQILLNNCDCVSFVSKDLELKFKEIWKLKFKKTEITYAGVYSKEISDNDKKEFLNRFRIKETSIILLAQGFTSHELKAEGAKILIKAVKELTFIKPNIILIITGEGRFREDLRQFTEKEGVYNHVIFTGHLTNPYVPLAVCNIYTHISLGEGLPLALLEAMIMGKAIIATHVGGIPEAIKNGINGLLVDPIPEQISLNIKYVLENEDYARKIGFCGRNIAEDKFTWEKSVDKYIHIYEK